VTEAVGISGAADLHIAVAVAATDADDLYSVAGLILAIPGVERTNVSVIMRDAIPAPDSPAARTRRQPALTLRFPSGKRCTPSIWHLRPGSPPVYALSLECRSASLSRCLGSAPDPNRKRFVENIKERISRGT